MSECIAVEREGHLATVVIDRPEKLNALTRSMWRELGRVFGSLSAEERLRCVILRGAGERAFSPGNDIGEFATERRDVETARVYGADMRATLAALRSCRHPVLAQIHGLCVGGGLELASLCDIRVCGESSRFGIPVNRLGLVVSLPELQGLVDLVGRAQALEILLEGRVFGASEARERGLTPTWPRRHGPRPSASLPAHPWWRAGTSGSSIACPIRRR
jgi:enoyl-CoA hydratase/carnithine racemase